jgi:hypothetical protein
MHALRLKMLTMMMVLSVGQAGAQERSTIEVTPFFAMGSNGSSPIGASITFPVTSTLSVETEVGYRRGEGDIGAQVGDAHRCAVVQIGRSPGIGALSGRAGHFV